MRNQAQAAEFADLDTAPWALVLGTSAANMPASMTTRRWTARDAVLQLAICGERGWPDVSEHDGHVVCFDGELHNAPALARELGAPAFAGPADLVARAVARWGRGAFVHLKGAFGVAAWSRADDRLMLARDAAGTHPVFFAEAGGRVACATDAATLLRLPWIS